MNTINTSLVVSECSPYSIQQVINAGYLTIPTHIPAYPLRRVVYTWHLWHVTCKISSLPQTTRFCPSLLWSVANALLKVWMKVNVGSHSSTWIGLLGVFKELGLWHCVSFILIFYFGRRVSLRSSGWESELELTTLLLPLPQCWAYRDVYCWGLNTPSPAHQCHINTCHKATAPDCTFCIWKLLIIYLLFLVSH